ncbi:hypothetical protein FHW89_004584 [Mucilaginibacter sp. SG564]|nr:hypothetical protein [Mucilaginibacter sp. SG564]
MPAVIKLVEQTVVACLATNFHALVCLTHMFLNRLFKGVAVSPQKLRFGSHKHCN